MRTHLVLGLFLLTLLIDVSSADFFNGFQYAFPINCSGVAAGDQIKVNFSAGFTIAGSLESVYVNCQNNLSVYHNNSASTYQVWNLSSRVPTDVENGNGSSFSPAAVWGGATSVWHMMNASDLLGNNSLAVSGSVNFTTSSTRCISAGCAQLDINAYLYKNPGVYPSGTSASTFECWGWKAGNIGTGAYNGLYSYGTSGSPYGHNRAMWIYHDTGSTYSLTTDFYGAGGASSIPMSVSGAQPILNTMNYYVSRALSGSNGDTILNASWADYEAPTFNTDAGKLFAIGAQDTGDQQFSSASVAALDECRLWNVIRTTTQINETYKNMIGTPGYGDLGAQISNGTIPPTNSLSVGLVAPGNGTITSNKTQNFTYQTNSSWLATPVNVLLYLDGVVIANNTTTTNATLSNIHTTTNGVHSWYVFAYNSSNLSMNATSGTYSFEVNFTVSALVPGNNSILSGNTTTLYYSTTNFYDINCTTYLDGSNVDYRTVGSSSVIGVPVSPSVGSHTWYVGCVAGDNPGYSKNSSLMLFSMNISSFNYILSLTSGAENVISSPQALFYDMNGNLNVLYFTDDVGGNTLRIKTIVNNSVSATYNASLKAASAFIVAMREANQTVLLLLNATDTTKGWLVNLTSGIALSPITFTSAGVQGNTLYDPYTYAYTKQYSSLSLGNGSFYLFTVPLGSGSIIVRRNVSELSFGQIGGAFPNSVAASWQTIANSSNLTAWYYLNATDLGGGLSKITLKSYNGTDFSTVADVDASGYTTAQLNSSYGIFERYNSSTYVMTANLPNTTIFRVEDGRNATIAEQIAAPSHFFFVDKDTFLFFSKNGSATSAYSCYFGVSGNCSKFSSTSYGLVVPYERGAMTTAKRDSGNYDTVVRGIITSANATILYYNLNTYDIKYLCYDEMAETRDLFTVQIYTNSSSTILQNSSWGYVIPSAQLGSGLKKSYFICSAGTQRLFLSGLSGSYIIDSYSLLNISGAYYTFTVQDGYGQPIQGVKISAYRFSNLYQSFVVIEQGITDYTGAATFFLQPYAFYKMTVEQGGYLTLNFDYNPTSITSIILKMANTNTGLPIPTFSYLWDDVAYSVTPGVAFSTNATNATFQIASNASQLEYFGMQVIRNFPNGSSSVVYSNNVSSQPSGGTITFPITSTGSYQIQTFFKAQNHSAFVPFSRLFTYSNGSSSFIQARNEYIKNQPITGWTMYLFAVIIALLAAGWSSQYIGDGAGFAALAILWGFTLFMTPLPGSGVSDIVLVCMIQTGTVCTAAITPLIATSFTTLAVLAAFVARHYI